MKTTYITASASIITSTLVILIYNHYYKMNFEFLLNVMGYLGLQLMIGIVIFGTARTEKLKRLAQGLMIGAGIVGLVGFSICTVNFMKS